MEDGLGLSFHGGGKNIAGSGGIFFGGEQVHQIDN
jgi:hypothetical protein